MDDLLSPYLSGGESGRPDEGVEEVAGVAQLGRHLQDAPHEHLRKVIPGLVEE